MKYGDTFIIWFLLICSVFNAGAQSQLTDTATRDTVIIVREVNKKNPVPRVSRVEIKPKKMIKDGRSNKQANHIVFGDSIYVYVDHLDYLIQQSEALQDNPIVLYLNGKRIEGVNPIFKSESANPLVYILERNDSSNDAWNAIFRTTDILKKKINVSVGVKMDERTDLVADSRYSVVFILRSLWTTIVISLVVLGLVIFSIFLVVKKDLLSDQGPSNHKPYSLSRTQLFFWTAIILLSYIFIWFVTDDMNSIEATSLVLLGISVGTAAAAKFIDQSGRPEEEVAGKVIPPSKGFFYDILWDGKNISIHRYQNVLFNLVIGVFFIVEVLENYKMPALNDTVLILMGISSATYAALKTTESKGGGSGTKNEANLGIRDTAIPTTAEDEEIPVG